MFGFGEKKEKKAQEEKSEKRINMIIYFLM